MNKNTAVIVAESSYSATPQIGKLSILGRVNRAVGQAASFLNRNKFMFIFMFALCVFAMVNASAATTDFVYVDSDGSLGFNPGSALIAPILNAAVKGVVSAIPLVILAAAVAWIFRFTTGGKGGKK